MPDRIESANHRGAKSSNVRVAYLNTRYPSLSHTFIEREVRAVRAAGIEVHTFSVRRPAPHDVLGRDHKDAANETCYLLEGPASLIWGMLNAMKRPLAFLRTLREAYQLSPPGIRSIFLHLIYALEGVRLANEMKVRGLSHAHVHMANNGAAVALLATVFNRQLSYSLSIHGSAEFFHIDTCCLKTKVENAVFVRCISDYCRAQVMAWTDPRFWGRYHVVHCAVDTDLFQPKPPRAPGPLRIVTVGRLDPIKGYPQLLAACRKLCDMGIDWRLDMVGDGPQRAALEALIHELGLSDHVTLSGAVGQDRIQAHLDRADVMVISSFMEGVPVVLMEAMAKQLAVVATRVGGISELMQHEVNGLLVSPGSVDALAGALLRLARNPELLTKFACPARETILSEFSLDQLGPHMIGLFDRYCRVHPMDTEKEEGLCCTGSISVTDASIGRDVGAASEVASPLTEPNRQISEMLHG